MNDQKNNNSIRVPCNLRNGQKITVPIYVGDPMFGTHPFEFQSRWLSNTKGGHIPPEVMESYARLKEIADRNRVKFSELHQFIEAEVNGAKDSVAEYNRINAPLTPVQKPRPVPPVPQQQNPQQNLNKNTNNSE